MTAREDAYRWVMNLTRVRCLFTDGRVAHEGVVIAYQEQPTVEVRLDDGTRESWPLQAVREYAGPRVWPEWGEEPPVGTVGTTGGTMRTTTWEHRPDGWYCGREDCENCPCEWAEVAGWGGTLTEVTS